MRHFLSFAVIVTMAFGQAETPGRDCLLVAGVGCGTLTIHKTRRGDFLPDRREEKRIADQGMTFTFDRNDVLDSIVVTSKLFRTDRGISPGDTEDRVRQAYGTPKVKKLVLSKGEKQPIGSVGDRALAYPGILFVISHGDVWAIVIEAT